MNDLDEIREMIAALGNSQVDVMPPHETVAVLLNICTRLANEIERLDAELNRTRATS